MSVKNEKDVAGKALYLEFRSGVYTYQMVVYPETISMDNASILGSGVMARRTSVYHPRRNWSFAGSPIILGENNQALRDANGDFESMTEENAKEYASRRIKRLLESTMTSLAHKNWKMFKTPIVVEMTYKDVEQLKTSKTPNDLMRRIIRTRLAFGWGDSIHNEDPTSTPAV